ncbi:MAG: type II toxin-antitoxin system VapC family toxin [Coriobacteriales bacterium]|nr:type II toxin-antitoxin system VapC family toxin [Coriobacteriales bacterium]
MLDTHVLIWAANGALDSKATLKSTLAAIKDIDNDLCFSSAAVWEIVIKSERINVDPERLCSGLVARGYREIPITTAHALEAAKLPDIHKDPFDRIMLAQARLEGICLVTCDKVVLKYQEGVLEF